MQQVEFAGRQIDGLPATGFTVVDADTDTSPGPVPVMKIEHETSPSGREPSPPPR